MPTEHVEALQRGLVDERLATVVDLAAALDVTVSELARRAEELEGLG